ncbi:hypothetical protein TSMEX_008955 [Taenia solium]|eukprot:TsM_000435400 transcript=TsM_000435400 gene=TsM_000435400
MHPRGTRSHAEPIINCDLESANVLFFDGFIILKTGSFGSSKISGAINEESHFSPTCVQSYGLFKSMVSQSWITTEAIKYFPRPLRDQPFADPDLSSVALTVAQSNALPWNDVSLLNQQLAKLFSLAIGNASQLCTQVIPLSLGVAMASGRALVKEVPFAPSITTHTSSGHNKFHCLGFLAFTSLQ